MNLLKNYIFKKIIISISGLSVVFIGAIWLTQSLRFLELIVNHNISLDGYLGLIIFLLPDLVAISLPICVLIAGIQVYQKFIADNELAVMRSVGMSNVQISTPVIMIGVIGTIIIFIINVFIVPVAFQKFRDKEITIRNALSSSIINEGAFNLVKGVTFYVKERDVQGQMNGIFIHHDKEVKDGVCVPAYTIFAEKGQFIHNNKGVFLYLKKGHRQERNLTNNQMSFLYFDEFKYDLTPLVHSDGARPIKTYERTLRQLLNPESVGADESIKNRMIVEGHQRLLMPFQALLNALILASILLYGDLRRRRRKHKIITAFVLSALSQAMMISIFNVASSHLELLYISYGLMICLLSGFFALLYGYHLPDYFKAMLLRFYRKDAV